jgi:hypothetical protein
LPRLKPEIHTLSAEQQASFLVLIYVTQRAIDRSAVTGPLVREICTTSPKREEVHRLLKTLPYDFMGTRFAFTENDYTQFQRYWNSMFCDRGK